MENLPNLLCQVSSPRGVFNQEIKRLQMSEVNNLLVIGKLDINNTSFCFSSSNSSFSNFTVVT